GPENARSVRGNNDRTTPVTPWPGWAARAPAAGNAICSEYRTLPPSPRCAAKLVFAADLGWRPEVRRPTTPARTPSLVDRARSDLDVRLGRASPARHARSGMNTG